MEFGISMTSVANKMQAYAKTQNVQQVYLHLLRDLVHLSSDQGLKTIEIFSLPPFDAKLLSRISKEMKDLISPFKTSCHLPFADPNIDSFHAEVRKTARKEIKDVIELVSDMGIKSAVMHPGCRDVIYPEFYAFFARIPKRT
ncbi:MAG: sugar phosphate isomerase/epimerase [Candidatus Marsarchaeota archaeon]|nr:sugar phosphate isomerase/epimerase [Candidatus Marsarchaeota archaeon]